jgi:hypothetical protein
MAAEATRYTDPDLQLVCHRAVQHYRAEILEARLETKGMRLRGWVAES